MHSCIKLQNYADRFEVGGINFIKHIRFFKMGQPRPLFNLFSSFQTNITNVTANIRWRDSNSQPLEHESPPITTRPGYGAKSGHTAKL